MSKEQKYREPSMLLVSSYYGENNSFKMIPISDDCPYVECIYDPSINFLVVIGKNKKNGFHMTEKLDDDGYPMLIKNFDPQRHRSKAKKERKIIETYQEYYIIKKDEQIAFIKNFAINLEYSFEEYMIDKDIKEEANIIKGPLGKLLDKNGNEINPDLTKKVKKGKKIPMPKS